MVSAILAEACTTRMLSPLPSFSLAMKCCKISSSPLKLSRMSEVIACFRS